MTEGAKIVTTSDISDVEKDNKRLRKDMNKNIQKMKDMENAARKGAKGASDGMQGLIAKIGGISEAWNLVKSTAKAAIEEQKRQREVKFDVNLGVNQSFKAHFAQSFISRGSKEAKAEIKDTINEALRSGLTINQINEIKKGVVSGGGNLSQVSAIANAAAAGNIQDPQEFAKNTALTIQDVGLPKTAEGANKLNRTFFNLNRTQSVELNQIKNFGRAASTFQGFGKRFESNAQLFVDLLDAGKSPERAETAQKKFGNRLRTSKGDKTREKALKVFGLTPAQVDFAGEDIEDVVELFRDKYNPNLVTHDKALFDLFGEESAPVIKTMILKLQKEKVDLAAGVPGAALSFRKRASNLSGTEFFDNAISNVITPGVDIQATQNRIATKRFQAFQKKRKGILAKQGLEILELQVDADVQSEKISTAKGLKEKALISAQHKQAPVILDLIQIMTEFMTGGEDAGVRGFFQHPAAMILQSATKDVSKVLRAVNQSTLDAAGNSIVSDKVNPEAQP